VQKKMTSAEEFRARAGEEKEQSKVNTDAGDQKQKRHASVA
jgi:hypothetical protein